MRILAIILIILIIVLSGCQSPKKECDFTFFKWNIHESYYLKFNSSDTLYYINAYPYEEQTSFTILNNEEKDEIQNILDTISFPMKKEYVNSSIEDGETYVFNLKKGEQSKTVKIHEYKGLNQFLLFGKSLKEIKSLHEFTRTNKKFDLSVINKMLYVPPPPNYQIN